MNTITNMLQVINPYMLRIEEPTVPPTFFPLPPSNVYTTHPNERIDASKASIITQRMTTSLPPSNVYTTNNEHIGASEASIATDCVKRGRGCGVRAPTPLVRPPTKWGVNLDPLCGSEEIGFPTIENIFPVTAMENETVDSLQYKDSIFWCIHRHVYGIDPINEANHRHANREIDEKTKIIDFMKTNPLILKCMKLTKIAIQEIASDLMSKPQVTLFTLYAFSAYHKLRIVVVFPSTKSYLVYHFNQQDEDHVADRQTCYIQQSSTTDGPRYIHLDSLNEEGYVELCSWEKPLHAISSYKVEELNRLVIKINLPRQDVKMTKPILYQALWSYLRIK